MNMRTRSPSMKEKKEAAQDKILALLADHYSYGTLDGDILYREQIDRVAVLFGYAKGGYNFKKSRPAVSK